VVGRLVYLVDTNVWLELILDQEKSGEVRSFFQKLEGADLAITEFSLYSIGIILDSLKKSEAFVDFLSDTIEDSGIRIIRLGVSDLREAVFIGGKNNLDFDDAYQYVAAEKYNLIIVSFDSDFDRTERGRRTPAQVA
jgi:predicted nucleic acid-binding protein